MRHCNLHSSPSSSSTATTKTSQLRISCNLCTLQVLLIISAITIQVQQCHSVNMNSFLSKRSFVRLDHQLQHAHVSRRKQQQQQQQQQMKQIEHQLLVTNLKHSIDLHFKTALDIARGGATEEDSDEEYDDESSDDEYDNETSDEEEEDEEEESEEEESEDEYDGSEDEYDESEDESEDEEDEDELVEIASTTKSSSSGTSTDVTEYDEPLSLSPLTDMGITLGVMLLCNRLDLTNTKIIRIARFAFIAYVAIVQLFLIYVRYQAHNINDRTPITINNPLSNMLKNQLNSSGDMVKNMADSFLSSQSSVMEYDLSQAKSMNTSLLFPMIMLWILHFKLGQVQPLFFQTASGVKDFLMSPLFQTYILGRNLERPFKNPKMEEMSRRQEELASSDENELSSDETNDEGDSDDDDDDDEVSEVEDEEYDTDDEENDDESDEYDEYDDEEEDED